MKPWLHLTRWGLNCGVLVPSLLWPKSTFVWISVPTVLVVKDSPCPHSLQPPPRQGSVFVLRFLQGCGTGTRTKGWKHVFLESSSLTNLGLKTPSPASWVDFSSFCLATCCFWEVFCLFLLFFHFGNSLLPFYNSPFPTA